MPDGSTLIYKYDGSFEGLLCCVFESFYKREIPDGIIGPYEEQLSIFGFREIVTDKVRAQRVLNSIPARMGADALDFVQRAFLTCLPQKEWYLLQFLRKGYQHGSKVMRMLTDDVVDKLAKAVQHLGGEAHLLSGFIRFSIYGEVMAAQITPKNFVLPILAPHFIGRYPSEKFLIYDKTHEAVLLYEKEEMQIKFVESFELAQPDEEELKYRRLWKMYYDTIAIEGRYNPKCRMTHMPKRYWENMTEFASGNAGTKQVLRVDGAKLKSLPK